MKTLKLITKAVLTPITKALLMLTAVCVLIIAIPVVIVGFLLSLCEKKDKPENSSPRTQLIENLKN